MKYAVVLSSAILSACLLAGCAGHTRQANLQDVHGRILAQSDQGVVISVGSADAIAAGSELTVYRSVRVGTPKQIPYFTDQVTGEVRVEQILSPHAARATLLSGTASKGELVARPAAARHSGNAV